MPTDVLSSEGSAERPLPRRNERGQLMEMPHWNKPFQKGVAANPSGAGGEYHKALKLARTKSVAVVERMVQLAELDEIEPDGKLSPLSRKADARVAALACQWLWECGWGKTRSPSVDADDKPGVTIEQRRDEAMATLMAAFDRVLEASNRAPAEAAASTVEGDPSVVTIEQDQ